MKLLLLLLFVFLTEIMAGMAPMPPKGHPMPGPKPPMKKSAKKHKKKQHSGVNLGTIDINGIYHPVSPQEAQMLRTLSPAVARALLANLAMTNLYYYDVVGSAAGSTSSVTDYGYGQYWGAYGPVVGDQFPVRDFGAKLPNTQYGDPSVQNPKKGKKGKKRKKRQKRQKRTKIKQQ